MSFSMLTLVTALGWVGAIAGLVAYCMATQGRWTPSSLSFQITNLTGATLMLVVSASSGVWPSAAANVAWIVIGARALVTIVRERRQAHAETVVVEPDTVDLAA
jgi:hypothetical protein